MKAQDTVMSDEQIHRTRQNWFEKFSFEQLNENFPPRAVAEAQAEISFKAGIKEVMDYFSRHWMGQTRGMMLYEIPAKDRDFLEAGIIPEEVR